MYHFTSHASKRQREDDAHTSRTSPTMTSKRRPRTASPSPAPQPLSKRDKRRTILSDKLSDMFASFSNNYADHFYAQLAAIKCDMNLILQADPYANTPLEDDSEEIADLVAQAREELYRTRPWGPDGEASFSALSGRYYAKYVNEINMAMEERDKSLTEVYVCDGVWPLPVPSIRLTS